MSHLKGHKTTEGFAVDMCRDQLCVLEREPWQQCKVELPLPQMESRVCQDNKQVCKIKLQFRNTATLEQLGSYGCQPSWQSKILI